MLTLILRGSLDGQRRSAFCQSFSAELYAHDPALLLRLALDVLRYQLGADVDRLVVDEVEARSLPPEADEQEGELT